MKNSEFKSLIAEVAYNVGFGCKVNFASFDILNTWPKVISFLSLASGVVGLAVDAPFFKWISLVFVCFSIAALYISLNLGKKERYKSTGEALRTDLSQLRHLYADVKALPDDTEVSEELLDKLRELDATAQSKQEADQLLFSNWLAHSKFFGESQTGWICDELRLSLWKDKIPHSLKLYIIFPVISAGIIYLIYFLFQQFR